MPIKNTTLILLFALGFMSACGGPSTSRVELTSSLSFLSTDHEVIFLGRHYLSNTKFSVISEAESFSVDLLYGKWEFAVIAWEKTGSRFTGTPKCFTAIDKEVTRDTTELKLEITPGACDHEFFRKAEYLNSWSNEFQTIKVKANENLSSITTATSSYTLPSGFTAFKLVLKDSAGRNLASDCSSFGSTTPIKFPAFGRIFLDVEFRIFSDAACGTYSKSIYLPKGIVDHPAVSRVFDLSEDTVIFLANEKPAIIALNTNQTVISTIPGSPANQSSGTRSFSLRHSSHYTGTRAVDFGTIVAPTGVTLNLPSPPCNASGDCLLRFEYINSTGSPVDRLVFQYTLKDAQGIESNSAIAIACSGQVAGSCSF